MRQIKVSEATPIQLNWLVAKAQNTTVRLVGGRTYFGRNQYEGTSRFSPSTNWSQGGPIIEKEKIDLEFMDNFEAWCGSVAAMRCYVASKMGDVVEVPEELT